MPLTSIKVGVDSSQLSLLGISLENSHDYLTHLIIEGYLTQLQKTEDYLTQFNN